MRPPFATISRSHNEIFVGRHEVGELSIRTKKPVAFDTVSDIVPTGRFVIVDGFDVSGGGIIAEDNYPRRTHDTHHKSEHIFWSRGKVTPSQPLMVRFETSINLVFAKNNKVVNNHPRDMT